MPTREGGAADTHRLRDLRPDEVLYVVAHEIGHYKLHHLWWGALYAWLGTLVAIVLLAFVAYRVFWPVGSKPVPATLASARLVPGAGPMLLEFSSTR